MSRAACPSCGVTLDGALANELAAVAGQIERSAGNAALAGDGVRVAVRDPEYLVDLLRRAAAATDGAGRSRDRRRGAQPVTARKHPRAIRDEARLLALRSARIAEDAGDPEGAGQLRDLARAIARIRLIRRPGER